VSTLSCQGGEGLVDNLNRKAELYASICKEANDVSQTSDLCTMGKVKQK
jgi:hypothetical protein